MFFSLASKDRNIAATQLRISLIKSSASFYLNTRRMLWKLI